MTQQYLRRLELKVLTSGEEIDLSKMHVIFQTTHADVQTPNTALVRVYNLSDETRLKLRREGTRLEISAGYFSAQFGRIFSGEIKRFIHGTENGGIDRYLEIQAADSDNAYNTSLVNTSMPAGWTPSDMRNRLVEAFRAAGAGGISEGSAPAPDGPAAPRGAVLSGMTRDRMRELVASENANFSLEDRQIHIIRRDGFLPDDVIALTAATGLIGFPEQTPEGIIITSLLNPMVRYGRRVAINNRSVTEARFNLSYAGAPANSLIPGFNADGTYRVVAVDHKGDTMGTPWYTTMITIAIDGLVPPALASRGLG